MTCVFVAKRCACYILSCEFFSTCVCSNFSLSYKNRCLMLLSARPRSSRELVLVLVSLSSLVCSTFHFLASRHFSSPSLRGRTYGASESHSRDARKSHPRRLSLTS